VDYRDPITRFAQALEESSLERLAVDQRPLPAGPKHETRPEIERAAPSHEQRAALQLLEQERVATTRTRAAAERTLDQADRELTGLGLLARRRRAPRLAAEINAQRAIVQAADERLSVLEQRRKALLRAAPDQEQPAR